MSYFLTEEQEHDLNLFLDEENRKVCEEQLNSDDIDPQLKEIIRKTKEAGSPIPAFNPNHGYYTISFTPCNDGNRIYAHHHISNKSVAIFDPSITIIKDESKITNNEVVIEDEFDDVEYTINEPSNTPETWQDLHFSDDVMMDKFPPPPGVEDNLQLQV